MLNVSIFAQKFQTPFPRPNVWATATAPCFQNSNPTGGGPCRNPDFQLEIRFPVAGVGTRVREKRRRRRRVPARERGAKGGGWGERDVQVQSGAGIPRRVSVNWKRWGASYSWPAPPQICVKAGLFRLINGYFVLFLGTLA